MHCQATLQCSEFACNVVYISLTVMGMQQRVGTTSAQKDISY